MVPPAVGPKPGTMLMTPAGNPASAANCAMYRPKWYTVDQTKLRRKRKTNLEFKKIIKKRKMFIAVIKFIMRQKIKLSGKLGGRR